MTLSISLALTKWHATCTFRAVKRFMAISFGFAWDRCGG
jgi:hypothetical protein